MPSHMFTRLSCAMALIGATLPVSLAVTSEPTPKPTHAPTTFKPTRAPTAIPTESPNVPTAYPTSNSNDISGWAYISTYDSNDCSGNAFYVDGFQTGYCYAGSTAATSFMYTCTTSTIYVNSFELNENCKGNASSVETFTIGSSYYDPLNEYCETYQCSNWVSTSKLPIPDPSGSASYGISQYYDQTEFPCQYPVKYFGLLMDKCIVVDLISSLYLSSSYTVSYYSISTECSGYHSTQSYPSSCTATSAALINNEGEIDAEITSLLRSNTHGDRIVATSPRLKELVKRLFPNVISPSTDYAVDTITVNSVHREESINVAPEYFTDDSINKGTFVDNKMVTYSYSAPSIFSKTSSTLSGGGIAGTVIGCLAFVAIVGFLFYKYFLPETTFFGSNGKNTSKNSDVEIAGDNIIKSASAPNAVPAMGVPPQQQPQQGYVMSPMMMPQGQQPQQQTQVVMMMVRQPDGSMVAQPVQVTNGPPGSNGMMVVQQQQPMIVQGQAMSVTGSPMK